MVKNRMLRILATLLAGVMFITGIPFGFAEETVEPEVAIEQISNKSMVSVQLEEGDTANEVENIPAETLLEKSSETILEEPVEIGAETETMVDNIPNTKAEEDLSEETVEATMQEAAQAVAEAVTEEAVTEEAQAEFSLTEADIPEGFDLETVMMATHNSGCQHKDLYVYENYDEREYEPIDQYSHRCVSVLISRVLSCAECDETLQLVEVNQVITEILPHSWDNSESETDNLLYCWDCGNVRWVEYPCKHKVLAFGEDGNLFCYECDAKVDLNESDRCKHKEFYVYETGIPHVHYNEVDENTHLKTTETWIYDAADGSKRDADCLLCGKWLVVRKGKVVASDYSDRISSEREMESELEEHAFTEGICACGYSIPWIEFIDIADGDLVEKGSYLEVQWICDSYEEFIVNVKLLDGEPIPGSDDEDGINLLPLNKIQGESVVSFDVPDAAGKYIKIHVQGAENGMPSTTEREIYLLIKDQNKLTLEGRNMLTVGESVSLKVSNTDGDRIQAKKLVWTSSDKSIASVSRGTVKAKKAGVVTISAQDADGTSGSMEVTVRPKAESVTITINGEKAGSSAAIDLGKDVHTLQLGTLISPDAANQAVTWKSSSKKIASVDANGLVTGLKAGTASITATAVDGSRKTDTIKISVGISVKGIEINGKSELTAGNKAKMKAVIYPENATNKEVIWSSSDKRVASVSSSGRVTAKQVDSRKTVIITAKAKDGSGVLAEHEVVVCPAVSGVKIVQNGVETKKTEVGLGSALSLEAVVLPEGASGEISWKSSKPRVASVVDGVVTPIKIGTTVITASAPNGKKASCTIEVKATPVATATPQPTATVTPEPTATVTPAVTPTLPGGQLIADGTLAGGVKWILMDDGVLRIEGKGYIPNYRYPVSGDAPWYEYADKICEIVIGSGIESIGNYAFTGLFKAERVHIPSTVTSLGGGVFAGCKMLKSCIVPDSVRSMSWDVFYGCESITHIRISKNVKSISTYVFHDCKSLEVLEIPASVNSISRNALLNPSSKLVIYGEKGSYAENFAMRNSISFVAADAPVPTPTPEPTVTPTPEPTTTPDAGQTQTCGDYIYIPSDKNCTIVGYTGKDVDIIVPAQLNGLYVTAIGDGVFTNLDFVTRITLPSGVKRIGEAALGGCPKLEYVHLPEGLTEMGIQALAGNPCLRSIDLPETLSRIPQGAFLASGLESIQIPDSVTEIGEGAFSVCPNLREVHLGKGTERIGPYTFYHSVELRSIYISDGLKEIGDYAFWECSGLESIQLPDGLSRIGKSAFMDCSGLRTVSIPGSVKEIPEFAFSGCWRLTKVNLAEGTESIGNLSFYNCGTGLVVVMPKSLTGFPSGTFGSDAGFESDVTIYGFSGSHAEHFANRMQYKFIPISSLEEIGNVVFEGYVSGCITDLYSTDFLDEVVVVWSADNAHMYSYRVYLMDEEPTGSSADFTNAVKVLRDVAPGRDDGVSIGNKEIPTKGYMVIEVTAHAAADYIVGKSAWMAFRLHDRDPFDIDVVNGEIVVTGYNGNADKVVVPENLRGKKVVGIADEAFRETNVEEWVLSDSICSIGQAAFMDSAVKKIRLPQNEKLVLGASCFSGTKQLTFIDLPEGLKCIPSSCFSDSGLTEIIIPSTVTELQGAFDGCESLQRVDFNDCKITHIPYACFYGCNALDNVVIPDSVVSIEHRAFERTDASKPWPSVWIGKQVKAYINGDPSWGPETAFRYWKIYTPDDSHTAGYMPTLIELGYDLEYGGNGCSTMFPNHKYIVENIELRNEEGGLHGHKIISECKYCGNRTEEEKDSYPEDCWRCAAKEQNAGTASLPLKSFDILERYKLQGKVYYRFYLVEAVNGIQPTENWLESSYFMDGNLRVVTNAEILEELLRTQLYMGSTNLDLEDMGISFGGTKLNDRAKEVQGLMVMYSEHLELASMIMKMDESFKSLGELAGRAVDLLTLDPENAVELLLNITTDSADMDTLTAAFQLKMMNEIAESCILEAELYWESIAAVVDREGYTVCEQAELSLQRYCSAYSLGEFAKENSSALIEEIKNTENLAGLRLRNLTKVFDGFISTRGNAFAKLLNALAKGVHGAVKGKEMDAKNFIDAAVEVSNILGDAKVGSDLYEIYQIYKGGMYMESSLLNLKGMLKKYDEKYAAFNIELEGKGLLNIHQTLAS